jgi:solute carrier family 8 (sodium/calcium exchanger)
VFAVTTIFSLWAYIWMWICVDDSYISITEGIMTCVFFVLLIVISFTADKLNKYRMSQRMSHEEQEEKVRQEMNKMKKDRLRSLCREFSEKAVIEVAQGLPAKESIGMTDEAKKEIKRLFCEIFETSDLKEVSINEMMSTLKHDQLLERFAYRKRDRTDKEFMRIKDSRGQLDHDEQARKHVKIENDVVGFKCLHYSVTESNGHVEVTIVKKAPDQELLVGVRTRDDTAVSPKDYREINEHIQFGIRDREMKIEIPIVDDEEWNPDLEFWVELFDPIKQEQGLDDRLPGDDTRCKVTILDEDFPGTIQFGETDVRVRKGATEVEIDIVRVDGNDGTISCMISTEPLTIEPSPQSA